MATLIDTASFILGIAALLTGLFFCICAGYLVERGKESEPLESHVIRTAFFLVSGGMIVGGVGYKLQFMLQAIIWNEQSPTTYTAQALLVANAIACAIFGMRISHNADQRPVDER